MTLSTSTTGASVYYTSNGATSDNSSTLYKGPITLSVTKTIQAIFAVPEWEASVVGSVNLHIE